MYQRHAVGEVEEEEERTNGRTMLPWWVITSGANEWTEIETEAEISSSGSGRGSSDKSADPPKRVRLGGWWWMVGGERGEWNGCGFSIGNRARSVY